MKHAVQALFLFLAGTLYSGPLLAGKFQQPDPVHLLIEKINTWYAVPREEVPLVTDRLYYEPGDTVWFKAYILDPRDHTPSGESNLLHVALVRGRGSVIHSLLLRQDANHLTGYFALPRQLDTGEIFLVAYTRWMLNFPGRDYSTRIIHIGRPASTRGTGSIPPPAAPGRDQVGFFPESGHLVGGYSNTVAFQATGPQGGPSLVSGQITDDRGEAVADFQGGPGGLGSFQVPVSARRTLIVHTRFADGTTRADTLPRAAPGAFIIHTEEAGKGNLRVTVVPGDSIPGGTRTILVAICGGKIGFAAYGTDGYAVNIPTLDFRQEMVRIAVFSLGLKPLAERWVLLNSGPPFSFRVSPGPPVSISIRGEAPAPGSPELSGSYYLIAADTGSMDVQAPAHDLPLESEGFPGPEDLLQRDSGSVTETNLRLMIRGWKATPWEEILSGPKIQFNHPPEMAQVVGGQVLDDSGKPVAERQVTLIPRLGGAPFSDTTDGSGRFIFQNLTIADSSGYLLSLARIKKGHEGKPRLIIDTTSGFRLPADFIPPGPASGVSAQMEAGPPDLKKNLDTVVVKDRPRTQQFHNANTILGDEIIKFTDPFDALRVLNGVQVTILDGTYHVIIGGLGSFHAQADPLLIIDGVEFPDLTPLESLNTADIDSMQVLRGDAEYGSRGGMGVIRVFTHKGGEAVVTGNDHILPLTLEGYEKPAPAAHPSPGRYWNDDIELDSSGDFQVPIPGVDLSGKYRASFRGVTDSGIPVRLDIPLKAPSD